MRIYSVTIVDDHKLLSQALASMVNGFKQFRVVSLARNGLDFIELFNTSNPKPDIVLMDVNMPKMNGIESTLWLKENHPDIKVLALSVENNYATILKMIKAGAKGYVLKDSEKEILESAMIQVLEKDFYHSKEVTEAIVENLQNQDKSIQELKPREIEFIRHICTEKTYKEIASDMCLSPKTIDGYRDVLFTKLQVKNRIGLVIYAIKHKYYSP